MYAKFDAVTKAIRVTIGYKNDPELLIYKFKLHPR